MKRDWLLLPSLALLGVAIFALFGLNRPVYVLLDEPTSPEQARSPAQVQIGHPAVVASTNSATIQVIAYLEPDGLAVAKGDSVQLEAGLWTSDIELLPPRGKRRSQVSLDAAKRTVEHEWRWTATPTRTGRYDFVLLVRGRQQDSLLFDYAHRFKITVLDLFGLNLGQVRALGSLSGLLGGALAWLALRSIWAGLKQASAQAEPTALPSPGIEVN